MTKPHSDWLPVRSSKVAPTEPGKGQTACQRHGDEQGPERHERAVKAEMPVTKKKKKKKSVQRIIILMAHESGSNNPKQRQVSTPAVLRESRSLSDEGDGGGMYNVGRLKQGREKHASTTNLGL